jgi:hypothetical protein
MRNSCSQPLAGRRWRPAAGIAKSADRAVGPIARVYYFRVPE